MRAREGWSGVCRERVCVVLPFPARVPRPTIAEREILMDRLALLQERYDAIARQWAEVKTHHHRR
jgi:hypothetical protein